MARRIDRQLALHHLFLFIGADPNVGWISDRVHIDDKGFIITGQSFDALCSFTRKPLPLETSVPNVFAIGDVRAGSTKRVAAAVGEGAAVADPTRVQLMLLSVLDKVPANRLACHFHDTSGMALANVDVALGYGIRIFDSAASGLGGCPYAPGAAGNVATGRLARHLSALNYEHGLGPAKLERARCMHANLSGSCGTTDFGSDRASALATMTALPVLSKASDCRADEGFVFYAVHHL